MRKLTQSLTLLLATLVFTLDISCRTLNSDKDKSETAATDASQPSSQNPQIAKGWGDDACLSCFCTVSVAPEKLGYKKVSEDPQVEWSNKAGYCHNKHLCTPFEYMNVWSPILIIKRCSDTQLLQRWDKREKTDETLLCFYEHPFFGGTEQCYKPGEYASFDASMTKKFSSFRSFYGAELEAWSENNFNGQEYKSQSDWVAELPENINDKISSFRVLQSSNRPKPQDLHVILENDKITQEIKSKIGSHGNHEAYVKALLDLAYDKINAKAAEQSKRGYHILIVRIQVKVDRDIKELIYSDIFPFKNENYVVYAFRSGTCTLHGDGGWKNWAMQGFFERTGDNGRVATFTEHP